MPCGEAYQIANPHVGLSVVFLSRTLIDSLAIDERKLYCSGQCYMTIRHPIWAHLIVYRTSTCASVTKDFNYAVSMQRTSLMLTGLYQGFGVCDHPCGLGATLCTLQHCCSVTAGSVCVPVTRLVGALHARLPTPRFSLRRSLLKPVQLLLPCCNIR